MVTTRLQPEGFAEAWQHASDVPGWLTLGQAEQLFEDALQVPTGGCILEIGSHQGRSTVVLASAARFAGAHVVAVDPFVEGRMFGGRATRDQFEANLASAGLRDLVRLVPEYSTRVRPRWNGQVSFLYIDGKHDLWTVSDDLRWMDFLERGSPLELHDCFSSIGVTLAVLLRVVPSRRLTYTGRVGSLARFVADPPTLRDRVRILGELPWWVRNVVVKILLRLRLYPLARLMGHHGSYDPY